MDDDLAPVPPWLRSVRPRVDPGAAARVEVEDEVAALREMVAGQQEVIDRLIKELEEERSASASATDEAMSMILRLQREKADVLMDARNFKRFAEEQMGHNQEEIAALEELLVRREEALQLLVFELEDCRGRLVGLGIDPGSLEVDRLPTVRLDDVSDCEYPQIRCEEVVHSEEDVCLQEELDELEKMRDGIGVVEKDVAESFEVERSENGPEFGVVENFPVVEDEPFDCGDEMSDRVYTVVQEVPIAFVSERDETMEKNDEFMQEGGLDIKKLYERLQALEEDRETMREAIIKMRTEKAQLALLKEMAQQLHKDGAAEKVAVKKKSWINTFSILIFAKWLVSFVLWRKKVSRSKYTFGLSNANVGLLLIVDKSCQISNRRYLSKITSKCN